MWTKEHWARHGRSAKQIDSLTEMVSRCAEQAMVRCLERADPARSRMATLFLAVVRAIA